jgi:predicted dithiol-disulfide oxidoreductase (DUF899 family)
MKTKEQHRRETNLGSDPNPENRDAGRSKTMSATLEHGPKVVSRDQWLAVRTALLAREKAVTRELDALRAERRRLPWVRVDKRYVFDAPGKPRSLGDLFEGRSQLVVYHFMLTSGSDHVCDGCAFVADHVDAARRHFEHADLSFAAVSRAPLAQIEPVRRRMGWSFTCVSSHGTDFNYDFGVSFTDEQIAAGLGAVARRVRAAAGQ